MIDIKSLHLTSTGELIVVDQDGKVIPELSCHLVELWAEHMAIKHCIFNEELDQRPVITAGAGLVLKVNHGSRFGFTVESNA